MELNSTAIGCRKNSHILELRGQRISHKTFSGPVRGSQLRAQQRITTRITAGTLNFTVQQCEELKRTRPLVVALLCSWDAMTFQAGLFLDSRW